MFLKRLTCQQHARRDMGLNGGIQYIFHSAYIAMGWVDVHNTAFHRCHQPASFNPDHNQDENIVRDNHRKGCIGGRIRHAYGHMIVDSYGNADLLTQGWMMKLSTALFYTRSSCNG